MKIITQEELNSKIQLHKKWLEYDPEGEKLELNGYDLSSLDLSYYDLRHANLKDTNLYDTNLGNSTLCNCNLEGARLSQSNTRSIKDIEIYSIDNIGTFKGKVTYLPKYDKVFAGCWNGTLEEFLEKGLEMNKEDYIECELIRMAYNFFKLCEVRYTNKI